MRSISVGGLGRDHADLGLRVGERDLDVEPGLPAGLALEERADAGVADAQVGGLFQAHHGLLDAAQMLREEPARASRAAHPGGRGHPRVYSLRGLTDHRAVATAAIAARTNAKHRTRARVRRPAPRRPRNPSMEWRASRRT